MKRFILSVWQRTLARNVVNFKFHSLSLTKDIGPKCCEFQVSFSQSDEGHWLETLYLKFHIWALHQRLSISRTIMDFHWCPCFAFHPVFLPVANGNKTRKGIRKSSQLLVESGHQLASRTFSYIKNTSYLSARW